MRNTIPREFVIEYQIAIANSISAENLIQVPGFIAYRKDPSTLYIDKKSGQVHFVNARTNIWRTTVIKSQEVLIKLAKENFHLFPNAGKK